jgi:hypothetical protein
MDAVSNAGIWAKTNGEKKGDGGMAETHVKGFLKPKR